MMFTKKLDLLPGDIHNNISEEEKIQCKDYLDNYEEISIDFKGVVSTEKRMLADLVAAKQQEYFPGRVLDVGCGTGLALNGVWSPTRVGLDISLGELRQIRDPFVTKVRSFAEDLPFADSYFDTVICLNVIEHVIDAEAVAKEIDRVLCREGVLYLSCPWMQELAVYDLPEYKKKYKQYKYKHLRSVDWNLIHELFPNYFTLHEEDIGLGEMEFDPYDIKFLVRKKIYGAKVSSKEVEMVR